METIKLGITLLLITAIAGGILAFTNSFTEPIIAEIEREESFKAFYDIFPDAEDFKELDNSVLNEITGSNEDVKEAYEVIEGGSTTAYLFITESGGYGGKITTIIGINLEGNLEGIKVTDNAETPGIGTKIEEDNFSSSFKDKSTENTLEAVDTPSDDNEVQMISGATISTNAVVKGVNAAREAYIDYLTN